MKDLRYGLLNGIYGELLPKRQHEIISSYYDYDLSLSEIADNYGITRQAALDAIRKGEKQLAKIEDKTGCLAVINKIKADIGIVRTLISDNNIDEADSMLARIAESI